MQDGKHVILCIDDDPDILVALRVVLESAGYRFVGAATATEGMEAYRSRRPDLIIVDLMMEQIDAGIHMVEELQASGNTAPVYILSSTGDYLHGAADLSGLGVTGVLQKPLDPGVLLSIIQRKLGQPAK